MNMYEKDINMNEREVNTQKMGVKINEKRNE